MTSPLCLNIRLVKLVLLTVTIV